MKFPPTLMRSTYRALMKKATAFDGSASSRVLLTAAPTRVYLHEHEQYVDVGRSPEWDAARAAVDEYVRRANNGRELYLPPATPEAAAQQATLRELVRESYRTRPLTAGSMNEAFAAVKLFATAAERVAHLPPEPLAAPGAAGSPGFSLAEEPDWTHAVALDTAKVIAAHPLLPGIFRHAIVCMIPPPPEAGDRERQSAMGFIMNRPLTNDHGAVIPVWAAFAGDAHPIFANLLSKNAVMMGGPVGSISGREVAVFVVHRIPNVADAMPVAPGVWATFRNYDALEERMKAESIDPSQVMVIAGYAGWGQAQLAGEVTSGSWFVAQRCRDGASEPTATPRESPPPPPPSADAPVAAEAAPSAPPLTDKDREIADFLLSCNAVVPEDGQLVTKNPTEAWSKLLASWGPEHADLTRLAQLTDDPRHEH